MTKAKSFSVYGSARYVAFLLFLLEGCEPAFELSDGFAVARNSVDQATPADMANSELSITFISPFIGPVTGNQLIKISGKGFHEGMSVSFGSKLATPVTVVSAKEIDFMLPAHLNNLATGEKTLGEVAVKIASGSETAQGNFIYVATDIQFGLTQTADNSSHKAPSLVRIHSNLDGSGHSGILVAKESNSLLQVLSRRDDGTFDDQTDTPFLADRVPGSILAFNFSSTDPVPDIFITAQDNLYRYPHGTRGSDIFQAAKPIGHFIKGIITVIKHGQDTNMVAIDNGNQPSAVVLSANDDGEPQMPINSISLASSSSGMVAAKFIKTTDWEDLAILSQQQDGTVSIFLGSNARGMFAAPTVYKVGGDPRAIVATDLNADGVTDLAIAAHGDKSINILFGNGDGTFSPYQSHFTGTYAPVALRAADLNGDGFPELVFLNEAEDGFTVLRNQGDGAFDLVPFTVAGALGVHREFDLGDLDHDGKVDIALTSYTAGKILYRLNSSP